MALTESIVKDGSFEWFGELGYAVGHGPQMAPGEPAAERESFRDVVLPARLREAIRRLNSAVPDEAREEALRKVLQVTTLSLVRAVRNRHLVTASILAVGSGVDGAAAGEAAVRRLAPTSFSGQLPTPGNRRFAPLDDEPFPLGAHNLKVLGSNPSPATNLRW